MKQPASPAPSALGRLGGWVLHHRRRVMLIWLVVFVAGLAGAGSVSNRLKVDFSLPGQPGYEAAKKVQQIYGSGIGQPPTILVLTAASGSSAKTDAAKLAAAVDDLRQARPALRIVDAGTTGDPRVLQPRRADDVRPALRAAGTRVLRARRVEST